MGNNKLSFQAELSELYRTGKTIGRSGAVVNATGLSTISNLTTIRELIIDKNPQSTLEIGMAYGGSALVILSTLQSIFGDNAQFHHTAIDPYQGQFDHAGVEIVKRAKLDQNFKWVESSSELALPKMVAEGIKYDFIYIDGSHLFEHVFVDMFYSLMLLNKGGIMLFDDSMDSHVAKVISFIKNNLNTYHRCPVNGVLIFEIMLFFIDKSWKRDVTDLNFLERQMLYCTDDIRSLYSVVQQFVCKLPTSPNHS